MASLSLRNISTRTLNLLYSQLQTEYEAAENAEEEALEAYKAAEATHDEALARKAEVRTAMQAIKQALNPIITMPVRSNTYPDTVYTVSIDTTQGNKVTCDCQSFRFERGLQNGTCKHIRYAFNNGLLERL